MTANETFCLRLNEFEDVIKSCWQELQIENDFCDITLACEDKQIKTHKFVISAFSPILRNILKLHQNPHPLIYLRTVKYINLQNLITFMYQGEVNVAEEDLPSFVEAAEDFNIRGLSEANTDVLITNRDSPSEPTHQDIASSPKRKRFAERHENARINGEKSSENRNFINTDDDKIYENSSREVVTQSYDESSSQNIVSTFTDKQFQCQKCDKFHVIKFSVIK